MRKRKITIALITALVMALTPMSVLADDVTTAGATETIEGSSSITPALDLDVFKVEVSTAADTDFVVDPQGLLHEADPTAYASDAGAVYFGEGAESSELSFKNLSSMGVNVGLTVSAAVTADEDDTNTIQLAESAEDVDAATDPTVYLALSVSGNDVDTPTALGTEEATVTETLAEIPKAEVSGNDVIKPGYKLTVTSTDNSDVPEEQKVSFPVGATTYYAWYALANVDGGSTASDIADSVTYVLSGKCSTEGWSGIGDTAAINTKIVWKVAKTGTEEEVVEIYAQWYSDNGGASFISMTPFVDGVAENPGFLGKTLMNFKVNGYDAPYHIDSEGGNAGYIYITDAEAIEAGVPATDTVYTITFTCDGINYKAVSQ